MTARHMEQLRRWWAIEPEYILPDPTNADEYRAVFQTSFFNVVEAIGRRDWRWRMEEDDMWCAQVMGEGGYFAEPVKGRSTASPDHFGMLEALLEAYLGALEHPENQGAYS